MSQLRRRDLLLSLKYSTIEACFSVPMLNLTMPNLPFVIAFATTVLAWSPNAVGWMAALPHLCNFVQPAFMIFLQSRFSLYSVMRVGFALSALPWLFVALLIWNGPAHGAYFAGLLALSTIANSVTSVAWSASIAEVVPPRISGSYFGRRNLIFGFWTLLIVLAAGQWVGRSEKPLHSFAIIFALACFARMAGLIFLTRMKFPENVMQPRGKVMGMSDFQNVVADKNYLWMILFMGLWGLFLNMGMPFYTVFLLHHMDFSIGDVVKLTTLASVGGLITLRGWGLLSDRFGSKSVLQICCVLWTVVALVSWSLTREGSHLHLYFNYFIVGAATAGFQLCQFNLMIKLGPSVNRAPFISVFLALTSLLTALGPILGGLVATLIPAETVLPGGVFFRYHFLFVFSLLACLGSLFVLRRVHETEAASVEAVWRTMRTMRTFNPLLGLATVAELLLTPRGLMGLARQSLRSIKKQAKIIHDLKGK